MKQKLKLKIKEKYYNAVIRPTKNERRSLKEDIMLNGQLEPIVCNSKGYILDGHTRFEICEELGIEPIYRIQNFNDEYEEYKFVIVTNVIRRQLTPYARIESFRDIIEIEKQKSKERQLAGAKKSPGDKLDKNRRGGTNVMLSRTTGIGQKNVFYAMKLMENASDNMKNSLREGTMNIFKAYNTMMSESDPDGWKVRRMNLKDRKYEHCPRCSNSVIDNPTNCHAHKKYCCSNCYWGI